jgi:hypothetical protein
MANPFGSGAAIVIPLSTPVPADEPDYASLEAVDEASSVRPRAPRSVPPSPNGTPQVLDLLERLLGALGEREEGLTALELRVALAASPDLLQRAIAVGLRDRRMRRVGSRCKLRYLLNTGA